MNKAIKLRIARPTDNLKTLSKMYEKGLGLEVLAKFENHENFDGIILGHPNIDYHIEFTHHKGTKVGKAPTIENLLVFYLTFNQILIKTLELHLIYIYTSF